jgi:signal transduction histidine kinase/phage shock protein PspC (stress-responsive transcriptional regulator)
MPSGACDDRFDQPRPPLHRSLTIDTTVSTAPGYEVPRLYRDRDNRIVAGVAAGLARHLRVPVATVRVAFVALFAANGLGVLLYVAFWAVLPAGSSSAGRDGGLGPVRVGPPGSAGASAMPMGPAAALPAPRPRRLRDVLPFFALAAGVIMLQIQFQWLGSKAAVISMVALIALGAGIIWHQADPQRRRRLSDRFPEGLLGRLTGRGGTETTPVDAAAGLIGDMSAAVSGARRGFVLRFIGGGLLVVTGVIGILTVYVFPLLNLDFSSILVSLIFALLALTGMVLVLSPLLLRIFGQLREERVARIRETERAELAALVHDQVLHTLALIQRNASDITSVQRLARGQERSLRNWLYKPTGSPNERFAAAMEQAAAEVEDTYAIAVETVIVGDAEANEAVAALVAATREALVNAARHAKVPSVALYAEVEDDQFSVYVRDRGAGFDLSTVEEDRHGVRGSIIGRMQRHGGKAEIRTSPGEGTEVALTMPRMKGQS